MAGTIINTFSADDINLLAMMTCMDSLNRGLANVVLSDDATPVIKAGSIVEVSGSVYLFDADTSITGTLVDGALYIKMVPYLDGAVQKVSPEWSTVEPVVSQEKGGMYGSGDYATHRYIYSMFLSSGVYSAQLALFGQEQEPLKQTKTAVISSGGSITFDFPVWKIADLKIMQTDYKAVEGSIYLTAITISGNTVTFTGIPTSVVVCTAVADMLDKTFITPHDYKLVVQTLTGTLTTYDIDFVFDFDVVSFNLGCSGSGGSIYKINNVSLYDSKTVRINITGAYAAGSPPTFTEIPFLVMARG